MIVAFVVAVVVVAVWFNDASVATAAAMTLKSPTSSSGTRGVRRNIPAQFPVSTRQALIRKSQRINDPSVTGVVGGTYTSAGWSNRAATVLTPVVVAGDEEEQNCARPGAANIYTADRPFYWNNIDVGCRCTVIELPSSDKKTKPDLWIHAPVGLDGPLRSSLGALGRVKHVVSPNYEHVKFAPEWSLAYPATTSNTNDNTNDNSNDGEEDDSSTTCFWACPGLAEMKPEVAWTGEIPRGIRPEGFVAGDDNVQVPAAFWDTSVIETIHVDTEENPFTGKPFFNEVVFFHRPTKTCIMTDLFWNYPTAVPNAEFGRDDSWELSPSLLGENGGSGIPAGSRLWKFGMDKVYGPFYNNFMITNRKEYRALCRHIVDVWEPEIVIPAHGDLLRGKEFIRKVLTDHFQL